MFTGGLDRLEEIVHVVNESRSNQIIVWAFCGFIAIWGGAWAARISLNRAGQGNGRGGSLGKANAAADDAPSPVEAEAARLAQEAGVAIASLVAGISEFRAAAIPETDIVNRVRGAADELAKLRASLAPDAGGWPGLASIRAQTLAFIDGGDFGAASAALERGFEAIATDAGDRRRDKAEIYAAAATIDHLRLDYCAAAEKYAAALALVEASGGEGFDGKAAWRFCMDEAREYFADGCEFGHWASFPKAIECCQRALGLICRTETPRDWAVTQFHLGNALLASCTCDNDADRLEQAVDAYLAALEEWTSEGAPMEWASAQNNLGDALRSLGEGEGGLERLSPAVDAYRAALQQWTPDGDPALWAMAQANLGDALSVIGLRSGDKAPLRDAIAAYQAALEATSREAAPLDWAMMQNNLGNALEALGEQEGGADRIGEAIAAYKAALEERTRDRAPSAFATTANNLGNALLALGERGGGEKILEEAAGAYRAALEERSKEGAPLEAAKIQINLAYALGAIWNRTQRPRMLEEAIAMLDAAIAAFKEAGERQPLPDAGLARQAFVSALNRAA